MPGMRESKRTVGGISIHVVDVSRGVVARGMRVEVWRLPQPGTGESRHRLVDAHIDDAGSLPAPVLMGEAVQTGRYAVVFHVADYYRMHSVALPAEPFLDVVHYEFGVDDVCQHYHLPMKTTPWGYSCFRGGA